MRRYFIFGIIVLVILWFSLLPAKAIDTTGNDRHIIVAGNNQFAFELYAKLKDDAKAVGPDGNLFLSPYSISTALAMTWAGARGETEKQMAKALHFTLPQDRLHAAFGALEKKLNKGGKKGGYDACAHRCQPVCRGQGAGRVLRY